MWWRVISFFYDFCSFWSDAVNTMNKMIFLFIAFGSQQFHTITNAIPCYLLTFVVRYSRQFHFQILSMLLTLCCKLYRIFCRSVERRRECHLHCTSLKLDMYFQILRFSYRELTALLSSMQNLVKIGQELRTDRQKNNNYGVVSCAIIAAIIVHFLQVC